MCHSRDRVGQQLRRCGCSGKGGGGKSMNDCIWFRQRVIVELSATGRRCGGHGVRNILVKGVCKSSFLSQIIGSFVAGDTLMGWHMHPFQGSCVVVNEVQQNGGKELPAACRLGRGGNQSARKT